MDAIKMKKVSNIQKEYKNKNRDELLNELDLLVKNTNELITKIMSDDLTSSIQVVDEYTKVLLDNYSDMIGPEGKRLLMDIRREISSLELNLHKIIELSESIGR